MFPPRPVQLQTRDPSLHCQVAGEVSGRLRLGFGVLGDGMKGKQRGRAGLRKMLLKYSLSKVEVKLLGHVRLFVTPWTVAYQASQSMGFSRQEYWSRLPFPPPGDLPNPGIKPESPTL